ncbi:MAG TPA: winged helix-turn-helix domain-containing protein [Solirubrobacteraceae bacterium]
MLGDSDIAHVAALIGDPGRARVLTALGDGRELSASVLAAEAGVAASTASVHLAKLVDGGLVVVERRGRHRYFRLAGPEVAQTLEALARIAPTAPVRSLREGTRAQAIRSARTCYDHLAGRLGVTIMSALIADGVLAGGDGRHHRARAREDRPSAIGRDLDYRLTEAGAERLRALGVDVDHAMAGPRAPIRYCVDWSEQDHHLSGALGAALATRLFELRWVKRLPRTRAVLLTDDGRRGLGERLGVAVS